MAANFVVVHARCFTAEAVQHDAFSEPIGEHMITRMIAVLKQLYGRR